MPLYKLEVQAERAPDEAEGPDVFGPYLIEATDPAAARSLIGLNFQRHAITRPATPLSSFFSGHSVSRCEEVAADATGIETRKTRPTPRIRQALDLGSDRVARLVWWPTAPWERCPL